MVTIPVVWKMWIPPAAAKSMILSAEQWELVLCCKWLHIHITWKKILTLLKGILVIPKIPCVSGSTTSCFHNHMRETNHTQIYGSKLMNKTRPMQSPFCHMVLQLAGPGPSCWCAKWLHSYHLIGLQERILLDPKSHPSQGFDGPWEQ
jgi:hypothetical protein